MNDEVYSTPKSDLGATSEWKRSIWLTGWLWLMLIATLINIPGTYLMADEIIAFTPQMTMWMVYMIIAMSVLQCIFVVFLLKNRKVGYYGIAAGVVVVFFFNAYMMGAQSGVTGLIGFVILSVLLFKGGPNSAWAHCK